MRGVTGLDDRTFQSAVARQDHHGGAEQNLRAAMILKSGENQNQRRPINRMISDVGSDLREQQQQKTNFTRREKLKVEEKSANASRSGRGRNRWSRIRTR
ncbi:MAG: hypothetical protein R3C59_20750 [Planctomycetaceae bacterium]